MRVTHLGGHSSQTCLALGAQTACYDGRDLERIQYLRDGASLEMSEAGGPMIMGIFVFAALGLVLGVSGAAFLRTALRRRVQVRVRVTPRSLEVLSTSGKPRRPAIDRTRREAVRVVLLRRGGRGAFPVFAIVYGEEAPSCAIVEWTTFTGAPELEPFAARLREALAAVAPVTSA